MSRPPGSQGQEPFVASPRTPGSLGRNDAGDPDTPLWFLGDTPGSLGANDYADPTFVDTVPRGHRGGGALLVAYAGLVLPLPIGAVPAATVQFDITKIPGIMRANGWHNGARLLDRWFGGPANDDPKKAVPDTTTIKMDKWVLTFERAKKVYDQIFAEKVYANPAAQKEIVKMLRAKRLGPGKTLFGGFTRPVPDIDPDYINERSVGSLTDDFDDMTAALGRFNFRIVVGGFVVPTTVAGKTVYVATIDSVGVYVRDSFDFNGTQVLGFWSDSGPSRYLHGTLVTNADFRKWRTDHQRGEDFLVYSDLKVTALSTPVVFDFS